MTQILYKPGDETYWKGCDPETKLQYSQIRGHSNDETVKRMTTVVCMRAEFPSRTTPRPSRTRWRHRLHRWRLRHSSNCNHWTAWRVAVTSVRYWWGPGGGDRLAAHHRSLYAPVDLRGRPIVAEPLSYLLQQWYHIIITVVLLFCARNRFTRLSPVADIDKSPSSVFVLFSEKNLLFTYRRLYDRSS